MDNPFPETRWRRSLKHLLTLILTVYLVGSVSAQSVKERMQSQERERARVEQRDAKEREELAERRQGPEREGFWVSCGPYRDVYAFYKGTVFWQIDQGKLAWPSRYSVKKEIVSWRSNPGRTEYELHLKENELWSVDIGPHKCTVLRGTLSALK